MKPQILELTENEVAAVLQSLSKQPYEDVADLIAVARGEQQNQEFDYTMKL